MDLPKSGDIIMIQDIDEAKCWREDDSQYVCRCVKCTDLFFGYKRRNVCKVCDALLTAEVKPELTQEEKSELMATIVRLADEIEEMRIMMIGKVCTE